MNWGIFSVSVHPIAPYAPATVVDRFLEHLARHPSRPLYSFPDGKRLTLTWSRLAHRAFAVVDELRRHGVRPGDRVVLCYPPDSTHFPAALWGCMLAGVVAVPVAPARPLTLEADAERFARLVHDCGARFALTESRYRRLVRVGRATRLAHVALRGANIGWPRISWIASDRLGASTHTAAPIHTARPEDLAYLQYTSGTTSDPKGVEVRHRALLANVQAMGRDAAMTSDDILVGWVPWFHDMGLVAGFFNVAHHAAHYVSFSPLAFLKDPSLWMRTVHAFRATATAAPNFGYALATRRARPEEVAQLDLSTLRLALLGGEAAQPDTLRGFAQQFGPAGFHIDAFRNVYGMAEAVLYICGIDQAMSRIIAVDRKALGEGRVACVDPAASDALELVSLGTTDETTALVAVRDGQLCPDKTVGELWLRSPSVAGAYFGAPERSAETFGGVLRNETGTYLRTGDLGFRLDGHTYICGREKDLIIIGGRNVHPEDVEQCVAKSHPALRPGSVAAFAHAAEGEEQVVVVCEIRDPNAPPAQLASEVVPAIRAAVTRTHDVTCHCVVLLAPRGLPKTTSGKIQRARCREKWRAGLLPVVHEARAS